MESKMACVPCQQKARQRLAQQEIEKTKAKAKATSKPRRKSAYNSKDGFCPACRWLLQKLVTYDPKTGVVKKQQVCMNEKCGFKKKG
jgi:hypothetical protein